MNHGIFTTVFNWWNSEPLHNLDDSTQILPSGKRLHNYGKIHHAMKMGSHQLFRLGHFQVRKLFVYQILHLVTLPALLPSRLCWASSTVEEKSRQLRQAMEWDGFFGSAPSQIRKIMKNPWKSCKIIRISEKYGKIYEPSSSEFSKVVLNCSKSFHKPSPTKVIGSIIPSHVLFAFAIEPVKTTTELFHQDKFFCWITTHLFTTFH